MIQYSAWLICYFGPYGYYGLWINVPNLCDVNKARRQTITLKITASFSVYIHIQSHGPRQIQPPTSQKHLFWRGASGKAYSQGHMPAGQQNTT